MNYQEIAHELRRAEKSCTALAPLTATYASLTVEDAYSIQKIGLEMALAEGQYIAGYKMGLTSIAKQRDVGVFEPIHGYLTKKGEVAKGASIERSRYIHPRAEPEVAVVLKSRLQGPGVTLRDVRASLAYAVPAIEILDSRFENFSFSLPDVIADNTSAAGFLLGHTELPLDDTLRLTGVLVKKNGGLLETGAPAAVLGDPLLSVVALANALAKHNLAIEPGMVVLTGGITASVSFDVGDVVEIVWPTETLSLRCGQ